MELVVFVLSAAMVLVGALGVITRSNPVHAALSLVLTLFGVAVMFVVPEFATAQMPTACWENWELATCTVDVPGALVGSEGALSCT